MRLAYCGLMALKLEYSSRRGRREQLQMLNLKTLRRLCEELYDSRVALDVTLVTSEKNKTFMRRIRVCIPSHNRSKQHYEIIYMKLHAVKFYYRRMYNECAY